MSAFVDERPLMLDLCCCAGGASAGYVRAGYRVVGVDVNAQPNYPYGFRQDDALDVLRALLAGLGVEFRLPSGLVVCYRLSDFAAIHGSPPCQLFTRAAFLDTTGEHVDLLTPMRELLIATGLPYVIENVPGAPMTDYVTLCGTEFGLTAPDVDGVPLQLKRHRQFESNVWLHGAGGCQHARGIKFASVYGHGGANTLAARDRKRGTGYIPTIPVIRQLLGLDDAHEMTKRELSESIPPAYTEFVGRQLLGALVLAS